MEGAEYALLLQVQKTKTAKVFNKSWLYGFITNYMYSIMIQVRTEFWFNIIALGILKFNNKNVFFNFIKDQYLLVITFFSLSCVKIHQPQFEGNLQHLLE